MMGERHDVAWGLERCAHGAAVLVRVTREDGGFVVTEVRAGVPSDPRELDGPLAVCLGEAFVAHRTLRLPPADEADTRRMIAAQALALAGGQGDAIAHGWWSGERADGEGRRRVTLAVARGDVVETSAAGLNGTAEAIEPATMGLARLWVVGDPSGLPVLLVHVRGGQSDCVIVDDQGPRAVASVDVGNDRWDEPGGLDAWAQQIREAWGDLLDRSSGEPAPARCVLLGGSDRAAGHLRVAVDLPVSRRPLPSSVRVQGGAEPDGLASAVGTALGLLCDDWPSVDLRSEPASPPAPQAPRRWWPWAVAGAWLIAATAGIMWADIAEARRLDERLAAARRRVSAGGGLERRLRIGRILEGGAPDPLDVMDRLSAVLPKSMILTRLTYDRSGELALSGTVQEPKDVAATLDALSALGEVELQRTGPENERRRIDLRVLLGRPRQTTSGAPAGARVGAEGPDANDAGGRDAPSGAVPAVPASPSHSGASMDSAGEPFDPFEQGGR